jgi:hypothetical protein
VEHENSVQIYTSNSHNKFYTVVSTNIICSSALSMANFNFSASRENSDIGL